VPCWNAGKTLPITINSRRLLSRGIDGPMTACGIIGVVGVKHKEEKQSDVGFRLGSPHTHGTFGGKPFDYGLPIWGELSIRDRVLAGGGWQVGFTWHWT
jgi:hypothetical protein